MNENEELKLMKDFQVHMLGINRRLLKAKILDKNNCLKFIYSKLKNSVEIIYNERYNVYHYITEKDFLPNGIIKKSFVIRHLSTRIIRDHDFPRGERTLKQFAEDYFEEGCYQHGLKYKHCQTTMNNEENCQMVIDYKKQLIQNKKVDKCLKNMEISCKYWAEYIGLKDKSFYEIKRIFYINHEVITNLIKRLQIDLESTDFNEIIWAAKLEKEWRD